MTMGVYCIQVEKESYWCSYVGISNNIERRWREHKKELNENYHYNPHLQNAWNKYGEDNFLFHILHKSDDYQKLSTLEKEYAYAFGYGDTDLCFNIGTPGKSCAMLGKKHTQKSRMKMGRSGILHPMFGKNLKNETKEKLQQVFSGSQTHFARLHEEQARFILTVKCKRTNKQSGDFKQQELADFFGVSVSCIEQIMGRHTWKYIEPLSDEEYEQFKDKFNLRGLRA